MHPLLVGGNPFTTTSIYGLILYLEKKWGIHYSMGGTGNIVKGLETLMIEENIKVIKGVEVKKIIEENKNINCKYEICNCWIRIWWTIGRFKT